MDLAAFENPKGGKKLSWDTRKKLIKSQFPAVDSLNWEAAFRADVGLLGLIIKDVLKSDQSSLGRPGPRPTLDPKRSVERYNQFIGDDYSLLPMDETLSNLKGKTSLRGLAAKTGLDYNKIYRLLNGTDAPDVASMQDIARAYGKHPSFFLEYRILFILGAIEQNLIESPESSVSAYIKLKNA